MENATETFIKISPLIPLSPASITFLDIILPPLLILLSIILHTIENPTSPTEKTLAHIYSNRSVHARFLPKESRHRFEYPTLFLGVDLLSLESGKLDLSRLFAWNPKRWVLLGLGPSSYLHATARVDESSGSIRDRLMEQIGHREGSAQMERIERVYTITMPSYGGYNGINPLTIHYCYERSGQDMRLAVVVLEVHNTFGERHIYILVCGKGEDERPQKGYTHQWTFPRAFHVSPFNDRSGYYRASLSDPLNVDGEGHTYDSMPTQPKLALKIVLLTSDRKSKKLLADLTGKGRPLTDGHLLASVLRQPLDLVLTSPRILAQAFKLHYGKRLDVYPRPEPFAGSVPASNPVQVGGKAETIFWQTPTADEVRATSLVARWLRLVADTLPADLDSVIFEALDPARPLIITPIAGNGNCRSLRVSYASPLVFQDLLLSRSPRQALRIGSEVERRWTVDDQELFERVFKPVGGPFIDRLRLWHLRWQQSFAEGSSGLLNTEAAYSTANLPLSFRLALFTYLLYTCLADRVGYSIFRVLGARFVKGTEPWAAWERARTSHPG